MPLVGALVAAGFAPEAAVAVGAVFIGLALALLAFAVFWLLREPLEAVLRGIPAIGGGLASAVSNGINSVASWANGVIGPAIQPILNVILVPIQGATAFVSMTVAAIEYLMHQVKLVTDAAAGAVGRVATDASQALVRVATATATAVAAGASALAANNLGKLIRYTLLPAAQAAAVAAAATFTRAQVGAEAAERAQAVAKAQAAAQAATAAEQLARQRADQQGAAAAQAAAAALAAALAGLSVHVRTETDAKVGSLEGELTDIRTRAIPAETERATTAELALTAELGVATEALRCLDPLCAGGFSGLVGNLLAGAELLALLELVGQGVRDPQGTAREVAGITAGVHDVIAGMLSPFVGRA